MNDLSTSSGASPGKPALSRIFVLARGVFALFGFAVALVVAVPQTRDGILNQFHAVVWKPEMRIALAPTADAIETGGPPAAPHALMMNSPDDQRESGYAASDPVRALHAVAYEPGRGAARAALTLYIADRYHVADEVVSRIVDTAYRAADANAIDPLIVLAVVATESNYNPIAESVVGAKGLMQIIAKFHPEKLADHGGENALFEPKVNIQVGAQILHEYMRRYGDLETALQVYAGAIEDSDTRYARKVLAERARLQQVLERSQRAA